MPLYDAKGAAAGSFPLPIALRHGCQLSQFDLKGILPLAAWLLCKLANISLELSYAFPSLSCIMLSWEAAFVYDFVGEDNLIERLNEMLMCEGCSVTTCIV